MASIKRGFILICDDDIKIANSIQEELSTSEYECHTVNAGDDAIEKLKASPYDILLLDLDIPRVPGIEVLKFASSNTPFTQVIMLTGSADVNTAVQCMKLGAYDYINKPFRMDELLQIVEKSIEKKNLLTNITILSKEIEQRQGINIIGESPTIKQLLEVASRAANSELPILIQGETGTGKELLAKYIHSVSPRNSKPIVTLNCASFPDTLFESELFGHEKGSFTDAKNTKLGLVEIANGGSLFLDEIGELSLQIQPKLLRFLETGEFRRIGSLSTRKSDVRIIAATNKNLEEEAQEKKFRQDLLFRLNVITLVAPPLRNRKDDIIPLANFFLKLKSKSKSIKLLSEEAENFLLTHQFPGNIRELEHLIERSLIFSDGETIFPKHFNYNYLPAAESNGSTIKESEIFDKPLSEYSSEQIEKIHIEAVLKENNWDRDKSANKLGISKKTLYSKIKKYNIE
ncbi:MAG: sigma-54-dependent Fis family transcriptional regulator [Ignavibacteria bacterium]|nr:sigma-54-dependent Fis family transcriptional regulator [Ignavibacteria bacterium]